MTAENEKTTEKIVREIVRYFNSLGYFLDETQIWSLLLIVYNSLGTEKEDGSREALSVARGSSHEDEMEKGHSLRVSPYQSDTTSSEMPEDEATWNEFCNQDELEKLLAIYSEGYATAEEEKRLKEIFEEKRKVRE